MYLVPMLSPWLVLLKSLARILPVLISIPLAYMPYRLEKNSLAISHVQSIESIPLAYRPYKLKKIA